VVNAITRSDFDTDLNILKIRRLKFFAAALFVGCVFVLSCSDGKDRRYIISESKAYEASLFRQNCAICHGPEGEGKTLSDGKQIPNLREGEFKYRTDAEIYRHISEGGNGMVPFRGQLTDREINLMVKFVQDELRK
jgi:cytochrome c553